MGDNFALSLDLATAHWHLPERSYTCIWSPDVCNYSPGDPSRRPGPEASRVYEGGPTGLYIFAYIKSCCLRAWLPVSLKLGVQQDSSLWNMDRSWHSLSNGNISGINLAA